MPEAGECGDVEAVVAGCRGFGCCVIGLGDALSSRKTADEVSQDVDLSQLCHHRFGRLLRRFEAVQPGGKSREPRIIKVGLLDLGGESGDEKSGIEQSFRGDVDGTPTLGKSDRVENGIKTRKSKWNRHRTIGRDLP